MPTFWYIRFILFGTLYTAFIWLGEKVNPENTAVFLLLFLFWVANIPTVSSIIIIRLLPWWWNLFFPLPPLTKSFQDLLYSMISLIAILTRKSCHTHIYRTWTSFANLGRIRIRQFRNFLHDKYLILFVLVIEYNMISIRIYSRREERKETHSPILIYNFSFLLSTNCSVNFL